MKKYKVCKLLICAIFSIILCFGVSQNLRFVDIDEGDYNASSDTNYLADLTPSSTKTDGGFNLFDDNDMVSTLSLASDSDDIVSFGSFPQTIKASNVSITSTVADANGYYTGSDGEKYAKVVANICGANSQYASDNTVMTTDNTYYFKVEPIKWNVLHDESGVSFAISDKVLTAMSYHTLSNVYANSSLRTFLNGNFYDKAFTDSEKAQISTTTVDNSVASTSRPTDSSHQYICDNTNDKIFALSYHDWNNPDYGFPTDSVVSTKRQFYVTDYAIACGVMYDSSTKVCSCVWQRTPANKTSDAAMIVNNGDPAYTMSVYCDYVGVVPALKFSL